MKNLTAERLRAVLDYDKATGHLIRRVSYHRIAPVGSVAGYVAKNGRRSGYRYASVDGKLYLAHRLVWLHVMGSWPTDCIDHINGERDDNRIENLRDVSRAVNQQNERKAHKTNKSGLLGVSPSRDRFKASITRSAKTVHLGTFSTGEEAHAAYVAAKRQYHEGNTL